MNQLTYRLSRVQIAAWCGVGLLLTSGGLATALSPTRPAPPPDQRAGTATTREASAGSGSAQPRAPGSPAAGGTVAGPGEGGVLAPDAVAAGGTLRLGAIITQSGLGDEHAIYSGLLAGIDWVNAHGGAGGRRLSVDVADDGTDPSAGAGELRRLVEQDRVFALVGECAPLTDADASEYVAQQGIPVVGPCLATNGQYRSRYHFPLVVQPLIAGRLMARYALQSMGVRHPAVVSLDVNVLDQSYQGIEAELRSRGITPCDDERVAVTQVDMDPVVINQDGRRCDGVILNLDPAHTLNWLQAARRYGYAPQRVALTGFDSSIVDHAAGEAEGMVTYYAQLMPTVETQDPAVRRFAEAMRTYQPAETDLNLAVLGYMAAISFAQVVSGIRGPLTRGALIAALESTTITNGLQPPLSFHPGDHVAQTSCRFYQMHQGAFQPVTGWYGE